MPTIQVNGARLYYEETGQGAGAIVFSHGLLMSCRMFDDQVAHFQDRYRCIVYDHRGQGQSEVTANGYDMETVYADAAALITALDAAPCHFVGLSMGGFVGMRLASRRPELLKSLLLLNTSADPEPQNNIFKYRLMNFIARWLGPSLVTGRVMPIMFGQKFMADDTRVVLRETWKQRMINNNRIGMTRATTGVIDRQGVYDELVKITVPTLILAGEQDVATVPAKAERIHQRISSSRYTLIPDAGHSSTVEEPGAVNSAIDAFLSDLTE